MVNLLSKIAITGVAIVAILYQFVFKDLLVGAVGYGRKTHSIKEYPNLKCERIEIPGLEACEDMWLHEETGLLYMACSTTQSRLSWLPAATLYDAPNRGKKDRIGMFDTRGTGPAASRLKWLSVENFPGNNGDGVFDLHGVSFLANSKSNMLRILLVNHRPYLDPVTQKEIPASPRGANSTIEHFLTEVGSSSIRHVRTHAHPLIHTPNSVQWVSDHAFILTNDHGSKHGFLREIDMLVPRGSIVYCDRNRCKTAVSKLNGPNGIIRARDGLIYVVHLIAREVLVYSLDTHGTLTHEDTIKIPLPIDNLSIDSEGDIYGAAFPQAYKILDSFKDASIRVPTAVLKISRGGKQRKGPLKQRDTEIYQGDYLVEKVLEDDGSLLPGSTKAIHDPKTGRIFLSGIISHFIAVCEKVK